MKVTIFKSLVFFAFIGMITVNFLANYLPLNNRTIGSISNSYRSYFTPVGFTFSIWGLIYILVGVVIVKILFASKDVFFSVYSEKFIWLFIASCILNITWLFTWHYDKMFFSTIIMILLLLSVSLIAFKIPEINFLTRLSFSIYSGWASIALIANITILLIKNDIPIFMDHQIIWYIIIMIVGVLIGAFIVISTKNIPYILVYIWAYFGIFMKHFQELGYFLEGKYNYFNGALILILIFVFVISLFTNQFTLFNE